MPVGWLAVDAKTHEPYHKSRPGYLRSQKQPPRIYTTAERAAAYGGEGTVAIPVYVAAPHGI